MGSNGVHIAPASLRRKSEELYWKTGEFRVFDNTSGVYKAKIAGGVRGKLRSGRI